MMSDIITVIAYKENWVDTCRGCVMERFDSDFDMFSSTKPESIIDFLTSNSERFSEYTFLINGRCVHYDSNYVSEDFPDDFDYDVMSAYEETIETIRQKARVRIAEMTARRKAAEAVAEQKRKDQEARAAEQRERNQLAVLKKKYEGG